MAKNQKKSSEKNIENGKGGLVVFEEISKISGTIHDNEVDIRCNTLILSPGKYFKKEGFVLVAATRNKNQNFHFVGFVGAFPENAKSTDNYKVLQNGKQSFSLVFSFGELKMIKQNKKMGEKVSVYSSIGAIPKKRLKKFLNQMS